MTESAYLAASLAHVALFRARDVKEGEEWRKIVYFWPSKEGLEKPAQEDKNESESEDDDDDDVRFSRAVPVEDQCRIVGLCEGLANFSAIFESGRPLESVRTKCTTGVLLPLGGDFWILLSAQNPRMVKVSRAEARKQRAMKKPFAGTGPDPNLDDAGEYLDEHDDGIHGGGGGAKDGKGRKDGKDRGAPSGSGFEASEESQPVSEEWKENDIDESCLLEVLRQLIASFRFFLGDFTTLLETLGEPRLKEICRAFFDTMVPTLAPARLSLFDSLDGMHFLPVDKNVYLQLQCFVSGLENSFPFVKSCTVLFSDHLLWSGLTEMDDLRVVYRYCTRFLSPWLREQAQFQAEEQKRRLAQGDDGFDEAPQRPRHSYAAPMLPFHTQAPLEARGWVIPDAGKPPPAAALDRRHSNDSEGGEFEVPPDPGLELPVVLLGGGARARLCIYQLQGLLCVMLLDPESEVADGNGSSPSDKKEDGAHFGPGLDSDAFPGRLTRPNTTRMALQQLADVVVGECAFLLPSLEEHLLAKTQQQLAAAGATPAEQAAVLGTSTADAMRGTETLSSDGTRFRYIYFNHMNLAVKSTVLQDWQTPYKLWRWNQTLVRKDARYLGRQYTGTLPSAPGGVMLPRETVKVLHDMHADFANVGWYEQQQRRTQKDAEAADRLHVEPGPGNGVSEVLVRTASDRWICGRSSEQREFYVVFETKSSHLIEVAEDVRRLADQYFAHVFVGI